jgi:hypothetical protein
LLTGTKDKTNIVNNNNSNNNDRTIAAMHALCRKRITILFVETSRPFMACELAIFQTQQK